MFVHCCCFMFIKWKHYLLICRKGHNPLSPFTHSTLFNTACLTFHNQLRRSISLNNELNWFVTSEHQHQLNIAIISRHLIVIRKYYMAQLNYIYRTIKFSFIYLYICVFVNICSVNLLTNSIEGECMFK